MPVVQKTAKRCEIINGEFYDMTPAPKVKHQRISGNVYFDIKNQIKKKKIKCDLFSAPTDVVFDEHNVAQPDIFIVCEFKSINTIYRKVLKGAKIVFIFNNFCLRITFSSVIPAKACPRPDRGRESRVQIPHQVMSPRA